MTQNIDLSQIELRARRLRAAYLASLFGRSKR